MSSPYTPPNFDGVVGHSGSEYLFPVKAHGTADPDLANAVNALFYADFSRWPTAYDTKGNPGTAIPLATTLVDCPDANNVVNWFAYNNSNFLEGIAAPVLANVLNDDAPGTTPYVDPATSSSPDAIYALNYLLDHDPYVVKA